MASRGWEEVDTYILFDNMAIIQMSDYISTWNCNLVVIG